MDKPIKQSVINTFNRLNFPYQDYLNLTNNVTSVQNWISGETCETTPLVAACIRKVYEITEAYERGDYSVKTSDYDRLRYFILDQDSNAYSVCID